MWWTLLSACTKDCQPGLEKGEDGLCYPVTDTALGPGDFELEATALATCEAPELRDSEGAFVEVDGGAAWQSEAVTDNFEEVYTGYGLAVADFDGDGLLDVYLPNRGLDQLFLGLGDGSFEDASDRLPQESAPSTGVTAVDVEGDGDLDVFVARLHEHNELLLNDGSGSFEASAERGWLEVSERTTMGSAWIDVDGDGDLDALVNHLSNWDPGWMEDTPTSGLDSWPDDLFFWNEGDAVLEPRGALPEDLGAGFTFVAMWFDHDGIGSPGLYIANDYRSEFDWIQSNRIFGWTGEAFEEASESSGAGMRSETMGLSVGDLNGDQRADVAMAARGKVHLLMSHETGWFDVGESVGLSWVADEPDDNAWGTELEDVDNDGDLDLAVGMGLLMADLPWDEVLTREILEEDRKFFFNPTMQHDRLYLQAEDGSFEDVAGDWGVDETMVTRGVVLADLDGDGWLDLLKRDMAGPTRIHMARCGSAHAVIVALEGPAPNPYGVGARVTASSGELQWTRWIHAGESLSSSAPPEAHIGLGEVDTIDLAVRWPDGEEVRFRDVGADQRLVVRHPDALAR